MCTNLPAPDAACLVAWRLVLGLFRAPRQWPTTFALRPTSMPPTVKIPVSQNTTLFRAGYVYDYLTHPQPAQAGRSRGRVRPAARPVHPAGSGAQGEGRGQDRRRAAVRQQAPGLATAKSSNAFTKFAADPEFDVDFSEDGELTLASPHITYRAQDRAGQHARGGRPVSRVLAIGTPGSTRCPIPARLRPLRGWPSTRNWPSGVWCPPKST